MVNRMDIVRVQIDLKYGSTNSGNSSRLRELKFDARIRIECPNDIGPRLTIFENGDKFYMRIVICDTHFFDRQSWVGAQSCRGMIGPSNHRERIFASHNTISFLNIVYFWCCHIDRYVTSSNRGLSLFYWKKWVDRIITMNRLIIPIRCHRKGYDKNRSKNDKYDRDDIFVHYKKHERIRATEIYGSFKKD